MSFIFIDFAQFYQFGSTCFITPPPSIRSSLPSSFYLFTSRVHLLYFLCAIRISHLFHLSFLSASSAHLAVLKKDLRHTRSHALAQGTYGNLSTQFKSFFLFCNFFNLVPLPVSLDTLCLYIQFLSRSLVPPSIRNYVSGVKHLHIVLGYEFPYSGHLVLKHVFAVSNDLILTCPEGLLRYFLVT